jgi:hypothetical protein
MSSALIGVDFTSAPSTRKPITVARGSLLQGRLRLQRLDSCPNFTAFEAVLAEPGPWTGAFDFPFGLPRAFVDDLDLGGDCAAVSAAVHRRCPARMDLRRLVDAWSAGRAPGQRLPHRRTDRSPGGVSSTSPLQTRYVPVGFMYFEGLSRLLAAGVELPGLCPGDPARRALEGYPALLAHELIGARSYKNHAGDDRRFARQDLLAAARQGRTRLGLRLKVRPALHRQLLADIGGDLVDAALCLMQAAWAAGQPDCGRPAQVDGVEGWIVTAECPPPPPAPPPALRPGFRR